MNDQQRKVSAGEVVQFPVTEIELCLKDGKPCYAGRDGDEAHWRCGTSACREPCQPPTGSAPTNQGLEN